MFLLAIFSTNLWTEHQIGDYQNVPPLPPFTYMYLHAHAHKHTPWGPLELHSWGHKIANIDVIQNCLTQSVRIPNIYTVTSIDLSF